MKNAGLFCNVFATLALCSSCVGLPRAPEPVICTYDNQSVEDRSNISPTFKCIGKSETRFIMRWDSEDADKMMAMPYQDYLKTMAYFKKLFEIMDRELLKRKGR